MEIISTEKFVYSRQRHKPKNSMSINGLLFTRDKSGTANVRQGGSEGKK